MSRHTARRLPRVCDSIIAKQLSHLIPTTITWRSNCDSIGRSGNPRFLCWTNDDFIRDTYQDWLNLEACSNAGRLSNETKWPSFGLDGKLGGRKGLPFVTICEYLARVGRKRDLDQNLGIHRKSEKIVKWFASNIRECQETIWLTD